MNTPLICNKSTSRLCLGRNSCPYAFRHSHPLPKGATCVDAKGGDFPVRSVPYRRREETKDGRGK